MTPLVNSARKKMNQPHISYVIVRLQLIKDFITWATTSWNQVVIMMPPSIKSYIPLKCRTDKELTKKGKT
jgi:hypothetical protein